MEPQSSVAEIAARIRPALSRQDRAQLHVAAAGSYLLAGLLFAQAGLVVLRSHTSAAIGAPIATTSPTEHIVGAVLAACAVLCIASAICLAGRKSYVFCVMAAATECLMIPVGPFLGIFALTVLLRPNVRAGFDNANPGRTAT